MSRGVRARLRSVTCALGVALAAISCGAAHSPLGTGPAARQPSLAEHYVATAEAQARRGDLLRAEQYLAAAVELGYPERRALPRLVRLCLAGGRVRAALSYAQSHLLHEPEDAGARYLAAALRAALGQPEQARWELRQVLAAHPEHASAHYLLATLSRDALHDARTTRAELGAYLALEPSGAHAAEARAWLEMQASARPTTRSRR